MQLKEWQSKHKLISIGSENLSYFDSETQKDTILILHEFGSSSFDYYKIIDLLKVQYRVIIPDLIGFGLSSKPQNYYNTILDHAQILIEFISELNIQSFSVLSHGFGTSIFCELINIVESNALKIEINDIFLLNGSLTIETTKNLSFQEIIENEITSKFIKITISFEFFKKYFKESLGKKDAVTEDELKVLWQLQNLNNGARIIKFIDYCIRERKLYSAKWIEILKSYSHKTFIIWGENDILSSLSSAELLKNTLNLSKIYTIQNCGHFPMFEKPKRFSELILKLKSQIQCVT